MTPPPGLALLLERGGARLVASPREVAGARVEACELAVRGAERPGSVAACRGRVGAVTRLRVAVPLEVLRGWVARRLVGAWVGGWRVGQVRWDRCDGTGEGWTLTGVGGGEPVWAHVEVGWGCEDGRLVVRARRCWLLGPRGLTAGGVWAGVARGLEGVGMRRMGEGLVIDAARAVLGRAFAGAGWRAPGLAGVRVEEVDGGIVVVSAEAGWSEGQVEEKPVEDPLAEVREGLRGSAAERVRACERLRALAAERPGLAGALVRARARALRFVDRAGCVAALREWLALGEDAEARWLLAVQSRGAEGLAELAAAPATAAVRTLRVLARAQALGRTAGGAAEARTLLEPEVLGEETPAEVWRTLARLRAADPSARAVEVEQAMTAALGEDGWRHRGEAGDLRGAVAEAVLRSGRPEATAAALLRRILVGPRRGQPAASGEEVTGLRRSTRIVADYYAQDGRWRELVALLERELGRLGEVGRAEALVRIARIRRLHAQGEPADA